MGEIRGIFHPPFSSFQLCKDLGFNYVETSLGIGVRDLENLGLIIDNAHATDLNAFVNPGFDEHFVDAMHWLKDAHIRPGDIVFLCDEPNDRKIPFKDVKDAHLVSKHFWPHNQTMVTLTAASPWWYSGCADILAIDYYGSLTWLNKLKLSLKIKILKAVHKGPILGIIPIRGSIQEIREYRSFWESLKVEGYLYYSFTPSEEKPPWFPVNLDQLPEIQLGLSMILGKGPI